MENQTETRRIGELLQNLYNGNPWLEVTLQTTLSGISAEQAAKKPGSMNSIWEITNHIISWRRNVLERVSGKTIITPEHNYFLPVTDTTESAWKQTLMDLQASQTEWNSFLNTMQDCKLDGIYSLNGHTHYEHIHGIIQHDAYHLGQIVLIAKHLV